MQTVNIEDGTSDSVQARIKYVIAGEKAFFYPTDREKSYWPVDEHIVTIENMRTHLDELALEKNGFVLVRQPTQVKNFRDPEEIRRIYYPEAADLVKRLTGAEKVIAFGDVVRTDDSNAVDGQLPAYGAHVDYGDITVRRFTEEILGEQEAAVWLKRRYVLINLWRPIRTVYKTPLALCDASSVAAADLNDSEVRGGLMNPDRPPLYGYNLSYNPRHHWYYAPVMQPDEVLAFKLFDSDRGRVQWTGHTAFDDPTSPADAPPRRSIEIRTISFFPQG